MTYKNVFSPRDPVKKWLLKCNSYNWKTDGYNANDENKENDNIYS